MEIPREYLIGNESTPSSLWIWREFASEDLFPILDQLPLQEKPEVVVWGNIVRQQRDVGFFSDMSIGYHFSNRLMPAQPLSVHPILSWLLNGTNEVLGTDFNGLLINRYRDGSNVIGAHSDDEKALDPTRKMVASIAFGTARKFRIRDKKTKKIVLDFDHIPRSLLVMEGNFQSEYTHEIPAQKLIKDPRISVTFRRHLH